MAKPVVEYLIGGPLTYASPYEVYSTVYYGTVTSASAGSVVMEYGGLTVVLRGSFQVNSGQVVAGTVTGFDLKHGDTKVAKGSGYAISYADLAAAGGDEVADLLFSGIMQKGSAGSDYLYGFDGNDELLGRGGNDWLWGGNGNDKIKGGDGDDFVSGYSGTNTLWGGAGKDLFNVGYNLSAKDKVMDFQPGKDTIGLEFNYFQSLGSGYLSKKEFAVGKNASADRAQVIYDKKGGALYYDEDGLGVAPKIKICELAPKLDLKASDIFVGFWD